MDKLFTEIEKATELKNLTFARYFATGVGPAPNTDE